MSQESNLAQGGPLGFSDAGRRVSDTIQLHLLADQEGNLGRWCAFKLEDGTSDNVVYDNPEDAAGHQTYYKACAYFQIKYSGMSPREADTMLGYYRRVYEAGNVPPVLQAYEQARQARRGAGLYLPGRDF